MLPNFFEEARQLEECSDLNKKLGFIEPLTNRHILPEDIEIQLPNLRESIVGNRLLSRTRAILCILESRYGSIDILKEKDIYVPEIYTGFANWMKLYFDNNRVFCSEYIDESAEHGSVQDHKDLCSLSYENAKFDICICNDIFEHVRDLGTAFCELYRVMKNRGRLMATCPMAFGQQDTIIKAIYDKDSGVTKVVDEAEFHGDPLRPGKGSLVYQIPGWDIVSQLKDAGFTEVQVHHVTSWKHGVLGWHIPGVLVIEGLKLHES